MKSRWSAFSALIFLLSLATAGYAAARRPAQTYPNREPLWTFATKGTVVSSPALSADGTTLYFGSEDHRFYAVPTEQEDPSVTTSNWSVRLPAPIYSCPVIGDNGVIYVGCMDGFLYAITDQGDYGQIEWKAYTSGKISTSPVVGDDETIYFGSTDNHLRALFPDSAMKWAYTASNNVATPIIAADGTILFASGGFLYGVTEDGEQVSSFSPFSAIKSIPALGVDDTIYLGAHNNRVYALNPDSGTNGVRWKFNTGEDIFSSPAVGADGLIYIASDSSRLYCFTTNGAVKWSVATRLPVRSALSIGPDGTIYAGCEDTRMYAVSPNGKILWTVKTGAAVHTSAAIDAYGTIYFGSGKKIYAVEGAAVVDFPESDEPVWQMFRKDRKHSALATACAPYIIQQPQTTNGATESSVTNGRPVSFFVVANAGSPVLYQWRRNGVDVDSTDNRSATNANFSLSSAQPTDEGDYTVFVSNDCGEVESEAFRLLVSSAPVFAASLTNQYLLAGNTLTLNAAASGSEPLLYQWYFNETNLVGTGATLTITNIQPANAGRYYVAVTNALGGATSATITVNVYEITLSLADRPLAAGQRHSLAALSDNTLWAWGLDNFGQLGNAISGTTGADLQSSNVPQLIGTNGAPATNAVWAALSGGSRGYDVATNQPGGFSVGIQTNGTLWAWGLNDRGQLGIDSVTSQRVPVRVGNATNWIQAEAGATHVIGLQRDGTIWSWGANDFGQLGLGAASGSLAPVRVGSDSAWVEVRAGGFFSLARRADGTIWAWGANAFGQLGVGNAANQLAPVMVGTNSDWATVSAGVFHGLGVKTNGTLWAWGRNNFGQLGLGTSGTGSDGFNTNRPAQSGLGTNWAVVAAGHSHSFGLQTDGSLWAWGANQAGQLGDGTSGSALNTNDANKNVPVPVAAGMIWRTVAASIHSLGMTTDGEVWGWGLNEYGQVGDGTGGDRSNNNNRNVPVLLAFNVNTNFMATNPPAISQQPTNRVANEGPGLTAFYIVPAGTGPFGYQWYFNSNVFTGNITGTNATLLLNAQHTNVGFYFVVITNGFGGLTSMVASLTVTNTNGVVWLPGGGVTTNGLVTNGPPVITQSPANQSIVTNNNASFSIMTVGAAPLAFQWRFNSNNVGTTNATAITAALTLTNVNSGDAGFYDVIVTNVFGAATSVVAKLTVTVGGPPLPGDTLEGSTDSSDIRIGLVSVTAAGVSVEVLHAGGQPRLVLEYKSSLAEPAWTPLRTNDSSDPILIDTVAPPTGNRFYRVRAE